ncbi:MAG TPA: hypothetical protein VIW72_10380 [Burkholderiales bacterium]
MRILILWFLFSPLFLSACARNSPYRDQSDGKACEISVPETMTSTYRESAAALEKEKCPTAVKVRIVGQHPYELAYVEINERGFFVDRMQVESALEMAGAPFDSKNGGHVRVLVFVHGWHHDASAGDKNVKGFHEALAALSRWSPNDEIRGVYIGWRGDSLALPMFRFLTFWDREHTSDEVGRGSSLYEFFMRLEQVVKGEPSTQNRLVVIGHSFGASVVFNSLSQLYMQRLLDVVYASGEMPKFQGYGDLVVFINPAIEARRYMPFKIVLSDYVMRQQTPRADLSNEVKPVLLILSSEGDWATRKAYQAARIFSTIIETHRPADSMGSERDQGPYSKWVMKLKAIGDHEAFKTHEVIHLVSASKTPQPKECPPLPKEDFDRLLRVSAEGVDQGFPDSGVVLKPKQGITPANLPYWNADLGKDIVSGHTDIWNLNFICWISQLVESQ